MRYLPTSTTILALLTLFLHATRAHMSMIDPPPFRSISNPRVPQENVDSDMNAPINGGNFPCKGYHADFDTAQGGPTATYRAGERYSFELTGSAAHGGGSCQVSLSYDGGATWKAIKSFEGNCARTVGGNEADRNQRYDFTVPREAPSGIALLAWTWFNRIGNREMYMNCAAVTIQGGGGSGLSSFPDMFVANVNNGCTTVEGTDLRFPDPGADVTVSPDANLGNISGSCKAPSDPRPPATIPTGEPEPMPSTTRRVPPAAAPTGGANGNPNAAPGGGASAPPAPKTMCVLASASGFGPQSVLVPRKHRRHLLYARDLTTSWRALSAFYVSSRRGAS